MPASIEARVEYPVSSATIATSSIAASDAGTSSVAGGEEDEDISGFDSAEDKQEFLKYTGRIQLLKEVLDIEQDKPESNDPIAVSADPVPLKVKHTLPASEGYVV